MAVKDFLVLLNSPNRNASAERALQKTREALELALDQVGRALGLGRTNQLKRILRIALNLSRAKGAYEGLCEGRRLHEFDMKIRGNPSLSYLTHRIRRFPEGTGQGKDSELCTYMDSQIRRLTKLHTVGNNDMPLPLESWGTKSWVEALGKKPRAVSKYMSQARDKVLSEDYTFLLAWERIGKSAPGGPKRKVKHRDLHLDKLYGCDEPKPAQKRSGHMTKEWIH
jgi:hypothetical protein